MVILQVRLPEGESEGSYGGYNNYEFMVNKGDLRSTILNVDFNVEYNPTNISKYNRDERIGYGIPKRETKVIYKE